MLFERGCGMRIVTDRESLPMNHPRWVVDLMRSFAIIWRDATNCPAFTRLQAGKGFVAIRWGITVAVGEYAFL